MSRMFITDLDGTLFRRPGEASSGALRALELLGRDGVTRVIATGRSLYSAAQVIPENFPVDYLIFSSGAGVTEWPSRGLLFSHGLDAPEVARCAEYLRAASFDFMVHDPVPDNHRFRYWRSAVRNEDFDRRLRRYERFAVPLDADDRHGRGAAQFVAVVPEEAGSHARIYGRVASDLADVKVIRTTSPLDGRSMWIEIFSTGVSKALASAELARSLGVPLDATFAVGNDYNDLDLLEWAAHSFVVPEAPADLRARFPVARGELEDGFCNAAASWFPACLG